MPRVGSGVDYAVKLIVHRNILVCSCVKVVVIIKNIEFIVGFPNK